MKSPRLVSVVEPLGDLGAGAKSKPRKTQNDIQVII